MTTDDGFPTSRPLPDLVGGRYRIVSRLGVGGMGVVYKAIDVQLNRPVAVKALEDRRLFLPGGTGRLREEALAAASLDHPYICKVYEFVEAGREAFIVMEFVEGETLASMLKRGPLPLGQVLQIGREIAEGLGEAHTRGLVHRDVKPSNVMVTASGHVKLLDFGVAVEDVSSTPADQTRSVTPNLTAHAGTPQYMAPEQAAGHPVTARADLFSLGVVLYESLTGALPFSGTSTFDYVRNMMQSAPRRLERLAPDTPAALVELVERCLEKSPGQRPDSVAAIVAELRALEDGVASSHGLLPTAQQVRSGRRWLMAAAATLVAVAAAAIWLWPRPGADPPLRQMRPFITSAAQEAGSRISPDGQWISFLSTAGGTSRVLVQRVDGGEARPLTLGPGTPISQIWSPDGSQIACVFRLNDDWVLQVYPAFFGGTPVASISLGPRLTQARLLRWIDQSVYLQVSDPEVSLRRADLNGADPVVLSDTWTLAGTLRSLDVRPDGRAVAFVQSIDGQEDLWVAEVDGSGARALTRDEFFERFPLWNGRGDRILYQSNRGGQIDLWEIDPRGGAPVQLTSGEMEKVAESTSADGSLISFQRLSHEAKLWLWDGADPAGRQLTQDALSDYSPVAAGGGLVFQRSQPIPSRGFTLIDARLFAASFTGTALSADARPVADGFAAAMSADGQWVAHLQQGETPGRARLIARNLMSGATHTITDTAALPISSRVPVDWASNTFAWTAREPGLVYVDQPAPSDPPVIRRVRPGEAAPAVQLVTADAADQSFRDLYEAPGSGHLAYVAASRSGVAVRLHDPRGGGERLLAQWDGPITGVFGRGWWRDRFVVVRRVALHEDLTADIDVHVIDPATGVVTRAGQVSRAFIATARLHAGRAALFVTRLDQGVHNLFELSLLTGALTPVTHNTLPGVTFSGFHPAGPATLIGSREERRQDIWLIQESRAHPSGSSAGR